MPSVTIRPGEPDEFTIPATVGWSRKREIGNMRRAVISVDRRDIQGENLNRKSDEISFGTIDDLILVDVEKGGSTWDLICYSHEWLANNVEPTPGGDLRTGTDKQLIEGLIAEVPGWTAGSITALTSDLQFVFSHAHRHEALRRIERNVPGEIKFRDSGTVDYVQELGQDKSASVELSASAGTIENVINITERGREYDGTHFRILGAHEGEAQIYANLVPSGDGASYENRVNYTTSRWSGSSDTDWDRWVNKDITDQATIEEEAAALGSEIDTELVEVETTTNLSLDVGDWVQVVKPDSDLDKKMRVHRVKQVSSDGTTVQELSLSTRSVVRQDTSRDLRKIREFSTGFQGSSVAIAFGPLSKGVNASNNLSLPVRYPDLEFENDATLHVKGSSYRVDSVTVASGGGSTSGAAAASIPENSLSTGFSNATSASGSETVPASANNQGLFASVDINLDSGVVNRVVIEDTTAGNVLYDVAVDGTNGRYILKVPLDSEHAVRTGNTIQVTGHFSASVSGTIDVAVVAEDDHTHSTPDHTHPVSPGIFTSGDTPSGVDVLVNGTTVATNIGTGSFETTVDISGDLTQDAWNTVELSSDSLGLIEATVYIEGYAQVGKV